MFITSIELKKKHLLPDNFSENDLKKETFKDTSRVHNWRKYVPEFFEEKWEDLSRDQKLIIIVMADGMASKEEWD